MDSEVYSNTSYRYSKDFFGSNPDFESRVSGGSKRYLSSSAMEKFPEAFFEIKPEKGKFSRIVGRKDNKRCYLYFDERYLLPPDNYDKYKVFISSSNGTGKFGETLTEPFIGEPYDGATETYMSIGRYDNENEAQNTIKYISTKFFRALLGLKKVTQGLKSNIIWQSIPLQDFTDNSDIDWNVSIADIDKQLYKKYGLTREEIDFVETHVKEMA